MKYCGTRRALKCRKESTSPCPESLYSVGSHLFTEFPLTWIIFWQRNERANQLMLSYAAASKPCVQKIVDALRECIRFQIPGNWVMAAECFLQRVRICYVTFWQHITAEILNKQMQHIATYIPITKWRVGRKTLDRVSGTLSFFTPLPRRCLVQF